MPQNPLDPRERKLVLETAAKYGAFNVRLFGSRARGDFHSDSDLDLLVDFQPERSLLDQIGLQQELADSLQRKVDVVTSTALHRAIQADVLREAVPV
jgi:predicted nucleotidyltransferase